MITISERGKRIMDLDLQWNKYCKENHIATDHVLVDVSW